MYEPVGVLDANPNTVVSESRLHTPRVLFQTYLSYICPSVGAEGKSRAISYRNPRITSIGRASNSNRINIFAARHRRTSLGYRASTRNVTATAGMGREKITVTPDPPAPPSKPLDPAPPPPPVDQYYASPSKPIVPPPAPPPAAPPAELAPPPVLTTASACNASSCNRGSPGHQHWHQPQYLCWAVPPAPLAEYPPPPPPEVLPPLPPVVPCFGVLVATVPTPYASTATRSPSQS